MDADGPRVTVTASRVREHPSRVVEAAAEVGARLREIEIPEASLETVFFIPLGASEALSEIWRRRAVQWPAIGVVALFLSKGLLNPDFARKLPSWRHSGFSIESETRIYDQEARQALSQYIVRPPLSLQKIHWDEDQDTVTWKDRP